MYFNYPIVHDIVAIMMPSSQYQLTVDNTTVAVLNRETSVVTALVLGETEIRLKDASILLLSYCYITCIILNSVVYSSICANFLMFYVGVLLLIV